MRELRERLAETWRSFPERFGGGRLGGSAAVVAAAAVAVLLVGSVVGGYAYASSSGEVLPGVRIAGLDVGGMTREEATAAIRGRVAEVLSRPLTVRAADRSWSVTPANLGARARAGVAVRRALAVERDLPLPSRLYHRVARVGVDRSVAVPLRIRRVEIRRFVGRVAAAFDVPARDAAVVPDGEDVRLRHARPGRAIRQAAAGAAIAQAIREGRRSASLPARRVAPAVADRELGRTIVIDLSTNTLRLYDGFDVLRTYEAATAKQGFDTPTGEWLVVAKAVNPSWRNPDPDGWGAGMPLYIPPGPGNPLGTRALYLDAPGIRIHGTPYSSSIGTYASHGCVRMHMADVEELFELVPVGTPVVVHGSPPWGAPDGGGIPGF